MSSALEQEPDYQAYASAVDKLVNVIRIGLEAHICEAKLLTVVMDEALGEELTLEKARGLLGVAALRMGKAKHEGDWA